MSEVRIRRVFMDSEHDNQKWLVLEGYVEGCPAVTKRDTINVAAIASGDISLAGRIAKMRADVAEYYVRWQTVQQLAGEL